MWKINRLYLKNFSHIFSGLDKTEVEIDFLNNDNILNIFIGKIGSGKSAILGHLQPYASYGTLDVRNQYDLILPEVDGLKEISFSHDGVIIDITHKYTWNKHSSSHNIKSFIKINGIEMNANGNNGSFKDIIKDEFGIEQNFLRLLRLGPNVSNLIDMKSTDRKNFIASLLPDAEIYTLLYKKLSEDLRNMNSKLSVLSNKLIVLSADKVDELVKELNHNTDMLKEYEKEIKSLSDSNSVLKGKNEVLLNGLTLLDTEDRIDDLNNTKRELSEKIKELEKKIDSSDTLSLEEITKEIGSMELIRRQIDDRMLELESLLNNLTSEYKRMKDMQNMTNDEAHMKDLNDVKINLEEKIDKYDKMLDGFKCQYNYDYLSNFIDNLSLVSDLINTTSENSVDSINTAYKADNSIDTFCRKKIDKITGRKINLQKSINNMRYSDNYTPIMNMYRPPLCPTKTCPYFKTHPCTIKTNTNKKKGELERTLDLIASLDVEISYFTELPIIYKRISSLKKLWNSNTKILKELNVLNNDNLLTVLTKLQYRQNWYDYNKLISILEKCKMREEYYELKENLNRTKNELNLLSNSDELKLSEKMELNRKEHQKLFDEVSQLSNDKTVYDKKYVSYESMLTDAQNKDINIKLLENYKREVEKLEKSIDELMSNRSQVLDNNEEIVRNQYKLNDININYQELSHNTNELRATVNDIMYTKKELDESSKDREVLKNILVATSSKDGIPLILIKLFLDNCKEIVNDLISDVFVDDMEILDFNITDTEFKIPYMYNGIVIDDIESASQGQRSIISIALSFALIRQSVFDYNIMLLDEIDGPLYKKDRDKFISILFKQLNAINANQVFLITHNTGIFEGNPVNIIMTTDEIIDKGKSQHVYKLF